MRKQELIHIHALCLILRDRLDDRVALPADVFTSYDAMDLSPTAVHRRKAEHRDAVVTLLTGLATALCEADEVPDDVSVDVARLVDGRED